LLVEVAYKWDVYGVVGWKLALLAFYWIFFTSILGHAAVWKLSFSGRGGGLVLFSFIVVAAAAILFGGVCSFLPNYPITQARFQTYTAQAAYLKSVSYFLVLAILFMILPFAFTIALQRELRSGHSDLVKQLLKGGKRAITPSGTIYPRLWVLTLLLATLGTIALFLTHNLFENLTVDRYTNLFQVLIYIRLLLYFTLGAECLTWYYWTMNEMRRESLGS
jgi:hypothetical protein